MMTKIIEAWGIERWKMLPLDYRIKIKVQWKKRILAKNKKGK